MTGMQSSRLWTLFIFGSAVATVVLIFFLDLTPDGPRERPLLADRRPGTPDGSARGLIILVAGDEGRAARSLQESLVRTKAERHFAVVETAWTNMLVELSAALDRHSIDRRRIFLMTRSVGLGGAIDCMASTGVIAAAHCWIDSGDEPVNLEGAVVPGNVTLVAENASAAPAAKSAAVSMAARGTHVVYREMEEGDGAEIHREQRQRDVIDDAVVWFTTLRNESVAVPHDDSRLLQEIMGERWAGLTREDFDHVARIGGPVAGEVILKALGSDSDKYRIAASARCKGTWFGQKVLDKLVGLPADPNEIVRLQAIDSLAILARWHNTQAQEALCRAALDAEMPDKDRATVVRELAESVRLDVPLGIAVRASDGADQLACLNPGGAWALRTFLGLLASDVPALRRAAEGAIWMWKVPDVGGEELAPTWRKRYPDELYESLSGGPEERRKAILDLKTWAAETYPAISPDAP